MKDDWMKLTYIEARGILRWLEYEKTYERSGRCPFDRAGVCYQLRRRGLDSFCKRLFPTLEKPNCPCHQLTLKYVVTKARKMLRARHDL